MAYDPNWPRWVQASVADHFKLVAIAQGYPALVEGIDERDTEFIESPNRIEIRVNGPFIREASAGYYHFEVDANILIFSHMGGQIPNAYFGTEMTGYMAQAASQPISIYKYGTGVGDDQSLIGCLTLRRGKDESVKVFHFGEVNKEDRLRQFGVDVSLEMDICP
jgi:hypothetical protein